MTKRTSIDQIEAGDEFRVAKGSRAGSLGVSGKAEVVALDGSSAQLKVSVGKFGFNIDIQLDLEREGDEVAVTANGSSFDELSFRARIVEESATEIRLEEIEGALADTHLLLDGEGGATINAEIPKLGDIALLIEPA